MLTALFAIYCCAVAGLMLYGFNSLYLVYQARKAEGRIGAPPLEGDALPMVTVQLPIYNERYVVERLLAAVAALDYPPDRLQVQLLDDSTDDTVPITARAVEHWSSAGLDVRHIRRGERSGYKAGALQAGMRSARGEFIAIFDADFVPPSDFLRRALGEFEAPDVALVQGRWTHINPEQSPLTRAQALGIDGHFAIEQAGRQQAGLPVNFNGTAGVWRATAIRDAGGWQGDTLTEDLDLSYRAQLAGWRLVYRNDLTVPAELPMEMSAFKSQQRRWAKGSIQTAIKLLPRLWRSSLPWAVRLEASLHLTHYLVHPLMLTVLLLSIPLLLFWEGTLAPLPFAALAVLLSACALGPSTMYLEAQRLLGRGRRVALLRLPLLLGIGTGLAFSNSQAVVAALLGIRSPFVRTPKYALDGQARAACRGTYGMQRDWTFIPEGLLALYAAVGLVLYTQQGKYLIGPFLALYAAGFAWVGWMSFREPWRRRAAARQEPAYAPATQEVTS